jgi:hypothetical protein
MLGGLPIINHHYHHLSSSIIIFIITCLNPSAHNPILKNWASTCHWTSDWLNKKGMGGVPHPKVWWGALVGSMHNLQVSTSGIFNWRRTKYVSCKNN